MNEKVLMFKDGVEQLVYLAYVPNRLRNGWLIVEAPPPAPLPASPPASPPAPLQIEELNLERGEKKAAEAAPVEVKPEPKLKAKAKAKAPKQRSK
jgi:hypothetical protein